jgi:phosphate/sulfate permease
VDTSQLVIWLGFTFAAYSVVGNDSIQTLGTFLSSNENKHWTTLWLFAGSILAATLIYGWFNYDGDVSYDRLAKYPELVDMSWVYLLPPLVLLVLTKTGIPVSTSFLILTFFNEKNMVDMILKSASGYVLAFGLAVILYLLITNIFEKHNSKTDMDPKQRSKWTIAQWASTGFLWAMWLIQDFANIYVYLPRALSLTELIVSLVILLGMLGYIFYQKGGTIQKIVKAKTNTTDIRSATIIDLLFGLILLFFKELNNVPMSTTWVFIGLLAGRELAIKFKFEELNKDTFKDIGLDLAKVFFGLVVSIALVYCIKLL